MPNNNRCLICGEIIPEGLQLCPNCFTASLKPKEKVFIEMDINAVPSEMTARVMLRLIENYCKQYGKIIVENSGKLDFENKSAQDWSSSFLNTFLGGK